MSGRLVCEFEVPGRAVPERKRQVPPRGAFRGARVDTQDAKDYKALVKLAASQAMRQRGLGPSPEAVAVDIEVWRERPKSWPKRRRWPTTKPDIENQVKLVADALSGIVYADDAQICDLQATKRLCEDGEGPRLWVRVTRLEPGDP